MIITGDFYNEWQHKGHKFGECMSRDDGDVMYVNIPKNASSWTKPNLASLDWEMYNYHRDKLTKHALVVLRDPVDRWLSGIAEYLAVYHPNFRLDSWNRDTFGLIFDQVCFDDHTARQVKFLHGLNSAKCTFFWCDEHYRENFSNYMNIDCNTIPYNHVTEEDPLRHSFKELFRETLENSKYLTQVKNYFKADYELINSVKFYGTR